MRPSTRGQATVELAVALPLLLTVAIGLVQFALFAHAQQVVTGAVQDGARVAAARDGTVTDGVARAETLLKAGLGTETEAVTVQGADIGGLVTVEASGSLHAVIPWAAAIELPLHARASERKERFDAGPSG